MENVVLWALSTGFVTGAVWVGIVLLRRRAGALDDATLDRARARLDRLDRLEDVRGRVSRAEERVDYAERVLTERTPAADRPNAPRSTS
jgi:hypothetical protein